MHRFFGIIMGMLDKLVDVLGEEKVTRLEYPADSGSGFPARYRWESSLRLRIRSWSGM